MMLKIGDRVKIEKNISIIHKKTKIKKFYGEIIYLGKYFVVVKLDNGWNESFRYNEVERLDDEGSRSK